MPAGTCSERLGRLIVITDEELAKAIKSLRISETDSQDIEVKASVGKLPASIVESVSAFANASGGVVVLGLSESEGFAPVAGFDASRISDALAGVCADRLTPPVRADVRIAVSEGMPVVVADIPEFPPSSKPCYVTDRGMYKGSFIRTGDGDRHLTQYEIDRLVEERTQPHHDAEVIEEASVDDLDADLLAGILSRQRALHPRVFAGLSDKDAMADLRIVGTGKDGATHPTLAGLLALGRYPQKHFPRLNVTFACYPGEKKAGKLGVKYVDSESMAGPIPAVLLDTVAAVRRNMRVGGVLDGALRRDVPDYPEAAVREAVCNALMHRDYSPLGRGSQVQVNMYADRLEVLNPGGLYGAVTVDLLGEPGASSTRNQHLALLLETTPYGEGGYVAENRGTGFQLMEAELAAAGMASPRAVDRPSLFSLTFERGGVYEADANSREEHGHTPEGDPVAECIARLGTARTVDIVRETGMPRSTVSYRLKRLLGQGLVEITIEGEARHSPARAYRIAR